MSKKQLFDGLIFHCFFGIEKNEKMLFLMDFGSPRASQGCPGLKFHVQDLERKNHGSGYHIWEKSFRELPLALGLPNPSITGKLVN